MLASILNCKEEPTDVRSLVRGQRPLPSRPSESADAGHKRIDNVHSYNCSRNSYLLPTVSIHNYRDYESLSNGYCYSLSPVRDRRESMFPIEVKLYHTLLCVKPPDELWPQAWAKPVVVYNTCRAPILMDIQQRMMSNRGTSRSLLQNNFIQPTAICCCQSGNNQWH